MEGGINEDATWSIRLRRYRSNEKGENGTGDSAKDVSILKVQHARFGKNIWSPLRDERNVINSMKELVSLFKGKVDLANPECRIYLLDVSR